MSSFLRRLRSTTRLHSPRSEPPPSSSRADSLSAPSPSSSSPRASSPTKLRQGPARRGYEALEGDQHVSDDGGDEDGIAPSLVIDSRLLDEGDEGGELGDWVWVDVEPAGAVSARGKQNLVSVGGARPAFSDSDVAPPLVPFSTSYALSPGRDPPRTPTKRKASLSSPELSPTASFSSALLSPSSPTSRTSTSSLAPPPTPTSPTPSVSLSLTIATRIDHNGRRVLTSRRRLSLKPSPCETRRQKDLYGIGDDEASGGEDEVGDDVRFAPSSAGLDLVEVGAAIRAPSLGLGMLDVDVFAAQGGSTSAPLPPSSPFEARSTRPRPVALQPLVIPSSSSPGHYESPLPSPTLARLPEHQPIKTFWPPPPLDPPSSPTKSAFSSLTRSNTTYSTRTSSSSSATGSSSAAKRHNSLLQPRRTFRRLSLSSRHGSTHGGAGPCAAPLMSATTFSSLHERRASAPALQPLDGASVDLERHTSMSSFGSGSGSGAFSMPPTPGATSSSSHFSFGTGASCSTIEPLLALVQQQSLSSGPCAHARRASQVSFELPPSTPSEVRRSAATALMGASDDGHAGSSASAGSASGSGPPLSPSSSFARSRRHARSASEGGSALQMSVLERSWVPLEDQAERELARGTLVVVNPDTAPASPPPRPSSSPIVASTPLGTSPPSSPSFSRTSRPSRPPKSLARWSAPPSPSPFLTSPQPPTPPAASRGIGVAC
ncbi:hypothetical protein JCM9279_006153 [Rhodotorula babjevae]